MTPPDMKRLAKRYITRIVAVILLMIDWIGRLLGFKLYKISLENILRHLPAHAQLEALHPLVAEPLDLLIKGYSTDDTLNIINRIVIVWNLRDLLRMRGNIAKMLGENPEIESYPIKKPLIVVGLQRSGTTLMTRLLSQDPQLRGQYTWEIYDLCEPDFPREQQDAARIRHVTNKFDLFDDLEFIGGSVSVHTAHRFDPMHHESASYLLEHTLFLAHYALTCASQGAYADWLHSRDLEDMTQRLQYHKKQLQIIAGKEMVDDTNKRFYIKAAAFMFSLEGVFKVYPDANVVFLHRPLSQCLPSFCSGFVMYGNWVKISASGKTGFTERALRATSKFTTNIMQILQHFDEYPPEERPVFDVTYERFVADPIATVKSMYEQFGMTLSEDIENKMRQFLDKNPQHKFGKHSYSLEEFGLSREIIYDTFKPYINFIANRTGQNPDDFI